MLKIIGGLMNATSGTILVDRNLKFAYIPERFDKINFTIPEYLYYIGSIDGLSKQQITTVTNELYRVFFLEDMIQTPMKFLSKGTLQKVAVIQALLVKSDILLLDEPLSGQDYLSQKKFVELMLQLKQEGVTIIMSCHEQFLVEQLSDRVLRIENYSMVETSITKDNKALLFYAMIFENNEKLESSIIEMIKKKKEVKDIIQKNNMIRIITRKDQGQGVLMEMIEAGYQLMKFDEI
jgi:ABC-type multidrug transport system ATPase subunit